jgi:hypothetical protein
MCLFALICEIHCQDALLALAQLKTFRVTVSRAVDSS